LQESKAFAWRKWQVQTVRTKKGLQNLLPLPENVPAQKIRNQALRVQAEKKTREGFCLDRRVSWSTYPG